jgi:hypothetical protein
MCVYIYIYILRILITKDKILPFSNYNVRIYNFLYKFAEHLKPCGGTPVAEHCTRGSRNQELVATTTHLYSPCHLSSDPIHVMVKVKLHLCLSTTVRWDIVGVMVQFNAL